LLEFENEAACGSQMVSISVTGSLSAVFGTGCMVVERVNSSQNLLDVVEKGLYSSFTSETMHWEWVQNITESYRHQQHDI
jgi:hypothetical protein